MLCVLALAALAVAFIRRGGGGGGFSWDLPGSGPPAPPGPPTAPSSSIVAARCAARASAKCRTCVIHRALGAQTQMALPAAK
jgi:hypothetical protein